MYEKPEARSQRCSVKKVFLKNSQHSQENTFARVLFRKVAGLRTVTLLKNRLWHRCFPVSFAKFLRTPFFQNTYGRVLLKTKEKILNKLPPTSSTIHRHSLRSHYFVYLSSNILDSCSKTFQPAKYEWIITKNFAIPSDLTTKCRCKKGSTKICRCRRTFDARSIATVQIARTYRFLELIWLALKCSML